MSVKATGIPVKIKKLHPDAKLPVKATPESACYDVYPLEDTVVAPRGSIILGTGLAVELPPGYELQIRPRSGYAFKNNVVAYWGTLDSDYTDEIKVKLFNFGDEPQKISKDKAVAQVCVKPVYEAVFVETGELRTKGHGGFGSTDKK
ncbi:MAG: dUTP diphosphatase [Desulfotomaculales bacterium]